MSKGLIIILVVLGVLGFGAFSCIGWGIGLKNDELKLRKKVYAQQDYCKTVLDKNRKTAQQKAGITDKYSEDFKAVYAGIMDGRYKAGSGQVFQMIKESNPAFSQDLYVDLSRTVEAQRVEYTAEQKKVIDGKLQHDILIGTFPGGMILKMLGAEELKITIVTSTDVENIYKTGKEDDVELFKKSGQK